MSIDRRNPYRPFDPASMEGFREEFLRGRTVSSAQLLPQGRSNTNYKLTLKGGGTFLLRLRSGGTAAQEAGGMKLVRGLIPVPTEIHRGNTWSVFNFLEGESLQRLPQYTSVAAEALAKISSVRLESAGWIGEDGSVTPFAFGGLSGYLRDALDDVLVRSWLDPQFMEAIQAILRRESGRMDELQSEHRLVHGDFNPTNILIDHGVVSGILDWEYCHAGTRYMDIGNLLRHSCPELHQQVRRGLEAGGEKLPRDWKERARLVDLASQLEFLTSSRSDTFKRRCVQRIEDFIGEFQN